MGTTGGDREQLQMDVSEADVYAVSAMARIH
jgi:hypothetical protein